MFNQAKTVTVNATTTQRSVCGIRPYRLYSFTVQVVNEDQIGPPSLPGSTMTDESSEFNFILNLFVRNFICMKNKGLVRLVPSFPKKKV